MSELCERLIVLGMTMALALSIIGVMEATAVGQACERLKARTIHLTHNIRLAGLSIAYSSTRLRKKYDKIFSRVGVFILIFLLWSLALAGSILIVAILLR
jgi:hypothetical protein